MKLLYILTICLLILPIAYAQDEFGSNFGVIETSKINIDNSVSWIMKQPRVTAQDAAFAVLAATKSTLVNNQDAIDTLISLKDKQIDCWPSSNCNTKDTSIALLSLIRAGSPITFTFLTNQEKANTEGEWLLQVETNSIGTCNIDYGEGSKQIQVENGRIKTDLCPFTTLFNLNDCLKAGLISNKISLDVTVNCGQLGAAKISLLYKADGKFFIVGEVLPNAIANFHLGNSNFKDYETTLYASWALKSAGKDINTIMWLKRFYTPSPLSSALMYLITEEDIYINDLLKFQDSGGFNSVYETSLATLALRKDGKYTTEVGLAKSWLESRMLEDGSWNKNIKDTAMAIYGAFASLDIDITPLAQAEIPSSKIEECNKDNQCDLFLGEDKVNCPSDCYCGDNVCDNSEDKLSCEQDCKEEPLLEEGEAEEEGRGFFFWLFIIIIILGVLGGLYYFYYKYYYITGKEVFKFAAKTPPLFKKPEIGQQAYPRAYPQPVYKPKKSLIEKQLEESLKESKSLFGKK